jgi:outer membrane protein assembly factor BamB
MNKLVLGLFLGVFLSFFFSCTFSSDSSSPNEVSSRPIKVSSIPEYPHPEKIQAYPLPDSFLYRHHQFASPLTVLNHRLYFISPMRKGAQGLMAFDVQKKQTLWIHEESNDHPLLEDMAISKNHIFVCSNIWDRAIGQELNFIKAIDLATGTERWRYYLSNNKDLHTIRWIRGPVYWNQQVIAMGYLASLVDGATKDEYFTKEEFFLIGLEESSGKLLWKYPLEEEDPYDGLCLFKLMGDKLYLSKSRNKQGKSNSLDVFDLNTHKFQQIQSIAVKDLFISEDEALFLGSYGEPLVLGSLDLIQKTLIWELDQENIPDAPLIIDNHGVFSWKDKLVFYDDYRLYTYKPQGKSSLPTLELEGLEFYAFHGAIQQEDMLYLAVGPQDWNQGTTYILAFNIETQQFAWKWKLGYFAESAYVHHGMEILNQSLYFHCTNGQVYEIPLLE